MLLTSLAVASLLSAPPIATASVPSARAVAEDHGKLTWFNGSFEEALAQAKASNRLLFIDFWTSW